MSESEEHVGEVRPIKPPMTQEQVEAWIMLKGQNKERWFEIRVLDPEVDAEPNMRALMETLSDMMQQGILGMPFMEAEGARKKVKLSAVSKGVKQGIVGQNGKPI